MEIITAEDFAASKAPRGRGALPSDQKFDWDTILKTALENPVRRIRGVDFDVKVATHIRHIIDAIRARGLQDELKVFVDTNRRDDAICIGPRHLIDENPGEDQPEADSDNS